LLWGHASVLKTAYINESLFLRIEAKQNPSTLKVNMQIHYHAKLLEKTLIYKTLNK